MSEVFHGYDERLDRRVAIKMLRPTPAYVPAEPDSPEAAEILDAQRRDRKRFLREIRTTAQLEHPGTPAVYDTGVEIAPTAASSCGSSCNCCAVLPWRPLLDHSTISRRHRA